MAIYPLGGVVYLAISGCVVNIGYFNFDKTSEVIRRVLKDWNGKAFVKKNHSQQ